MKKSHQYSPNSVYDLIGFVGVDGQQHETPFSEAYKNGGIVMLHEFSRWRSGMFTKALRAFHMKGIARHPDFTIKFED